jgi:hypothetical protein
VEIPYPKIYNAQGGMMISTSYNMKEFIEAVKDKNYFDVIYLTNHEATESERLSYRRREASSLNQNLSEYVNTLKGLILFMRHGIKAKGVSSGDFDLFGSISSYPYSKLVKNECPH